MAKREQSEKLFETDSPADARLKELATEYEDARDQQATWKDARKTAKEKIIARMKKKGDVVFKSGDLTIERSETDTIKVKRATKKDG